MHISLSDITFLAMILGYGMSFLALAYMLEMIFPNFLDSIFHWLDDKGRPDSLAEFIARRKTRN